MAVSVDQRIVTISVIIPTLNESKNIPWLITKMPSIVDELLFVDGNSTDDTVEVIRNSVPDAKILHQEGKGKGDALRQGFRNATGDILVTIDADGSMDPEEIPDFIDPIIRNGCDFVKGSRFLGKGGTHDMPLHRRLANKAFVIMVRLLYGEKFTDLCYGYNAFQRSILDKVEFESNGFEIETEMHIRVSKKKLVIAEVPSFEAKRNYGQGKLRTFRDGWRILMKIITERFRK